MTDIDVDKPRCGVCGAAVSADFFEPPTFSMQEVPGRPAAMRPVLNKPIRIDPETGAMCWCPPQLTEET